MNEYQPFPDSRQDFSGSEFSAETEAFHDTKTVTDAAQTPDAPYNVPHFTHSALGNYSVSGGAAAPYPVNQNLYPPVYAPVTTSFDIRKPVFTECVHKVGNAIGLPMCIFFFASIALKYAKEIISRIAFGSASAISRDPILSLASNAIVSILIMTLPYLITCKMTKHRLSDTVALEKFRIADIIPLSMLGLGVCSVGKYASSVLSSILDRFAGGSYSSSSSDPVGTAEVLMSVLSIAVVPAIVEEFAFRGVVLGTLRKYTSDGMSVFISAAAFGLIHGNLEQTPFAFCVGLVLGYTTVRTGSVIPGIVIHFLNNASSVLLSAASTAMSPAVETVISLSYFIFTLLLGICGFLLLCKSDDAPFRFPSHDTGDSKKFLASFCSSGWIVTFIIFCCTEIVLAQLMATGKIRL